MKTLIICASYHHQNTLKVARAMNEVLGGTIVAPADVDLSTLAGYDLIGFGSGAYNQFFHPSMLKLAAKLPELKGKKAFIFSTNTFGLRLFNDKFKPLLEQKGFSVVADFSCRGFIDFSFTRFFFGGISKGHPSEKELQAAREFARQLTLAAGG
ncbi:MAG: flavodoxin family protein [Candidatus Margulisbacteria bacterium]|jgi:flavodoxin|nr:flavodoxin family protein [Candidatus Margulisiibacteriota bacterium]